MLGIAPLVRAGDLSDMRDQRDERKDVERIVAKQRVQRQTSFRMNFGITLTPPLIIPTGARPRKRPRRAVILDRAALRKRRRLVVILNRVARWKGPVVVILSRAG